MKLMRLDELFQIQYGNGFELINMDEVSGESLNEVNFVARTARNNGVVARVERLPDTEPFKAGKLTVSLSGSVLESFVQPRDFYTSFHIFVLTPKRSMNIHELVYYSLCIRKNKYRYSYGRQANRTLKDLLVPSKVPESFIKQKILSNSITPITKQKVLLESQKWQWFMLSNLFDIKKGKRLTKENMHPGSTLFIGSSELDNGITAYIDKEPIHRGNTISVTYNGSVAEAFYQPKDFWASDDVNVLYPKFSLNPYIALFLITIIRKEKYRYNYGRKWHLERMKESRIKLPVDIKGIPDWLFMENFIKSLPYSNSLKRLA